MTDVNYMFSAEPRPVQVAERKQPKYRESVQHYSRTLPPHLVPLPRLASSCRLSTALLASALCVVCEQSCQHNV